eukprot:364923-Chlamydomonas_euryale.AAC.2
MRRGSDVITALQPHTLDMHGGVVVMRNSRPHVRWHKHMAAGLAAGVHLHHPTSDQQRSRASACGHMHDLPACHRCRRPRTLIATGSPVRWSTASMRSRCVSTLLYPVSRRARTNIGWFIKGSCRSSSSCARSASLIPRMWPVNEPGPCGILQPCCVPRGQGRRAPGMRQAGRGRGRGGGRDSLAEAAAAAAAAENTNENDDDG